MTAAHHQNPRLVALVGLGGMLGTAGRYLLTGTVHGTGGWPAATFLENIAGSFLLGALLEALVRRGNESRRGRVMRLGIGTGILGGFTTFSSLAIELERLLAAGAVTTATTYAVASVAGGLIACLLGVVLAARHHHWRHARPTPGPGAPNDRSIAEAVRDEAGR